MINNLTIKNFKSIKDVAFPCKKLNVFIGEPNSGKSNIIEAIALKSQNAFGRILNRDIFRYKTIGDLFYDFNINEPVQVVTDDLKTVLTYAIRQNKAPENKFHFYLSDKEPKGEPIILGHDGTVTDMGKIGSTSTNIMNISDLPPLFLDIYPTYQSLLVTICQPFC